MMETMETTLRANLMSVKEDIAAACARSGRDPADVTIIAVTKTAPPAALPALYAAGIRHFAENRWQQAREKLEVALPGPVTWHFIGHLQSNKVKDVVRHFDVIHSVDSQALAEHLSAAAQQQGRHIRCLLQVNISGEATKSGVTEAAAGPLLAAVWCLPNIEWVGLMTMAPRVTDMAEARPVFRRLRCLQEVLQRDYPTLKQLSMGMSEDFPVAVEEGATFVRIGRRLVNLPAVDGGLR